MEKLFPLDRMRKRERGEATLAHQPVDRAALLEQLNWPDLVWAGGVDGVDLMEHGTPEQVRAEVRRHILETNALRTGGMFVASSSEINPPIPPGNFRAMVEAVGELRNPTNSTGRVMPC